MLVIHPTDRTTAFLSTIYNGNDNYILLTQDNSPEEVRRAIHHLPKSEPLLLLGHGSGDGLFSRQVDTGAFDRIIVGHKHAFYLRGRSNIVGIWCNADQFARKEGLHGLFTGMIISEMSEALEYGITVTEEELLRENEVFAQRIAALYNGGTPLWKVPDELKTLVDRWTPLTEFNYNNIFYL